MTITKQMIDSHPANSGPMDRDALAACIDDCLTCVQTCTACADACLSEESVDQLRTCIRTNLDCADICYATARILSRHAGDDADLLRAVLTACATSCEACGDECAGHADHHDHCRVCADACRACEQACRDLLDAIGAGHQQ